MLSEKEKDTSNPIIVGAIALAMLPPVLQIPFIRPRCSDGTVLLSANASEVKKRHEQVLTIPIKSASNEKITQVTWPN